MTSRRARGRTLCLALVTAASAAAAAPRVTPAALGAIEPGRWEVVANGEPTRALCVADPVALTQVRHGGASCTRLVVVSAATSATVNYVCPGAGWGRTSVHVLSSHAVRIDTQGIAESAPFAFAGEARRTGACGARSGGMR